MSLAAGEKFGPYEILALIGAGGMGEVYRAFDTNLKRTVAIKLLSNDLAEAGSRRRFQREAQMASSLNHPHILTVYDAGELEGRQCIVTEFVDGGTLKIWSGPWQQAVELLTGVADGLAAAHAAGILHRDVKPANILLAKSGYAKLADFGLARFSPDRQREEETATLTLAGMVMGAIPYMSPEQACGQKIDARSDIFSFGAVLYEVLAGRRPFNGNTNLDIMQAVVHDTPVPLSEEIPPGLRNIVEKALEKDPASRYQSMKDLAVDLRRVRGLKPPLKGKTRHTTPTIQWAAAVVLIALASAAAWRFWPHPGVAQIRSLAVLPLRSLSRDADQEFFAAGMTEALHTDLAQINALIVIASTSAMRYQGATKRDQEIARELSVDALVEGAVQQVGDRVQITAQLIDGLTERVLWSKRYERDVRDRLALQGEVAQTIAEEIQVKLTPQERARLVSPPRSMNPEAQEAYERGVYSTRHDPDVGKALAFFQTATQKDPKFAPAWAGLGETYGISVFLGALPAKVGQPKMREAVTTALALDPDSAEARVSLAGLLFYIDWNWQEAEREFQRAFQLNPNTAGRDWYSDLLGCLGRKEEAVAQAREADRLDPYGSKGVLIQKLIYSGRNDEAIEQGQRMADQSTRDAGVKAAHHLMALAYEQNGDFEKAISLLKPENTADLAHVYSQAGKKKKALDLLAAMTESSKQQRDSAWAFAIVYAGLGDKTKAFEYLNQGFDVNDRPSGMTGIKADPRMEPLRSDPEYKKILRRMGLPE